jgi:Mor family transcriptional regulator
MSMPHWINLLPCFQFKYTINPVTNCWIWTGSTNIDGYGHLRCQGKMYQAHRVAYFLHHKTIDSREVCHTCNNPPCVNWEHLYLDTHIGNMKHMQSEGRRISFKGEENPRAKLTKQQVLEIRQIYKSGQPYKELADKYDVTPELIGQIVRGDIWRHIGGPLHQHNYTASHIHVYKLTEEDVIEILAKYKAGYRQCDLAKEYNVADATIHRILNGISWKHI